MNVVRWSDARDRHDEAVARGQAAAAVCRRIAFSSLQRFAACPYEFLPASISRLAPFEEALKQSRNWIH